MQGISRRGQIPFLWLLNKTRSKFVEHAFLPELPHLPSLGYFWVQQVFLEGGWTHYQDTPCGGCEHPSLWQLPTLSLSILTIPIFVLYTLTLGSLQVNLFQWLSQPPFSVLLSSIHHLAYHVLVLSGLWCLESTFHQEGINFTSLLAAMFWSSSFLSYLSTPMYNVTHFSSKSLSYSLPRCVDVACVISTPFGPTSHSFPAWPSNV